MRATVNWQFGAFILMMLERTDAFMLWTYLAVLFVPGLIVTVFTIRYGLLTWGSRERNNRENRSFALGVICGSLFFGIVTGGDRIYYDGTFHASGIVGALVVAAFWGICIYILMSFFVRKSENRADARVAKASFEEDNKDEEQENENSQSGM